MPSSTVLPQLPQSRSLLLPSRLSSGLFSSLSFISTSPHLSLPSRFATGFELSINAIGLVAAAASGASQVSLSTISHPTFSYSLSSHFLFRLLQPLMSLLFSRLTQDFVTFGTTLIQAEKGDAEAAQSLPAAAANFKHSAALNASYLVYIGMFPIPFSALISLLTFFLSGVGMFVCTYTYMVIWVYTAEVGAKRLRERYLRAILRQDIAYFDNVGAGEVATRIQTDTRASFSSYTLHCDNRSFFILADLVQQGISEKVALVVNFLAAFVTGFVLAYVRCWRLALAMSSMLPCIAIAGGVMNKFISSYMQLSLQHVAEGGTLAEEVISTIRTAQAFGTQRILSNLYDVQVDKSRVVDLKAAVWHGAGLSVFFFVIYGGYGLAFSFGTTLINHGEGTRSHGN